MAGDQLVDEAGQPVGLALRGASFQDEILADEITALREIPLNSGTQNPGVGRADPYQPDAIDLARLRERATLQRQQRGGEDNDRSEESHAICPDADAETPPRRRR